jgi:hypothetical protein
MAIEACKGHLEKIIPEEKKESDVKELVSAISENGKVYYYDDHRAELLDHINQITSDNRPIAISVLPDGLILSVSKEYPIKSSWGEDWKVPEGLKARSSEDYPGYAAISEQHLLEHINHTTSIE